MFKQCLTSLNWDAPLHPPAGVTRHRPKLALLVARYRLSFMQRILLSSNSAMAPLQEARQRLRYRARDSSSMGGMLHVSRFSLRLCLNYLSCLPVHRPPTVRAQSFRFGVCVLSDRSNGTVLSKKTSMLLVGGHWWLPARRAPCTCFGILAVLDLW